VTRRATKSEPSLFAEPTTETRTVATPSEPAVKKPKAPAWQTVPTGAVRGEHVITRGKDGWWYVPQRFAPSPLCGRCFRTMAAAVAFVETLP
jgi:hypothetical protein